MMYARSNMGVRVSQVKRLAAFRAEVLLPEAAQHVIAVHALRFRIGEIIQVCGHPFLRDRPVFNTSDL